MSNKLRKEERRGEVQPDNKDKGADADIKRHKYGTQAMADGPHSQKPLLPRYDAVLLDIDGTLVDSNGAHAAAWSDAFAAHGRHHPPEEIRPLIGKGGDKLLRELASLDHESGEGKKISEERAEIFRKSYLPTLKPTPGAAAFVEWLLESRLTVVVATSAKQEEVKALLKIGRASCRE